MIKRILAAIAALLLALPSVSAQTKFAKQLPKELHLPTESITEADRQKIIKYISLSPDSAKLGTDNATIRTAILSRFETWGLIETLYSNEQSGIYMRDWDDLGPTSETPAMQKYFAYGIRNARNKDEFLRYLIQYGDRASYDDERIIGEYCINKEWDNLSDELRYKALELAIDGIYGMYNKYNVNEKDILSVYRYTKESMKLSEKLYGKDSSQYSYFLELCSDAAMSPIIEDWEPVEQLYLYYKERPDATYHKGDIQNIFQEPLYGLYLKSVMEDKDFDKARNILDIMLRPIDRHNFFHSCVKIYGEAYTYLLYSKAQLDYWTGGTNYPELMKTAYDFALYILSPEGDEFGVTDYIIPAYRLAPSVTNYMNISYDSPDSGEAFDTALFLKDTADKLGVTILSMTDSSEDAELCEYIDSLRNNFDKIPEWRTQNPFDISHEAEFQAWSAREDRLYTKLNRAFHYRKLIEIWEDCIVHWQDVRDALKEDETAVEIVENEPLSGDYMEYKALILNSCDSIPTAVRLCSDSQLKKILGKGHIYGTNSGEIFDAVWKPILPHIRGHRLHLSPIGLLGGVNLAAIPDSTGRSMGGKFDIHFCTSTGWLVERDADEAQSNGNSAKWNRIELWGGLQSLPESGAEIKAVGKLAKAAGIETVIHSGADCTEESFRAISWKKTGIIHIAAHGFRSSRPQTGDYDEDEDNPLDRCGLILQDGAKNPLDGTHSGKKSSEMTFEERKRESGKSNAIDGVLLGSEIARMNLLGTDLVVLSACGSGKGDYTDEGVYSIARAFRKAGAKTVVTTLGRIPDGAAKLFMTEFYSHLFSGESKTAAFQAATAALKSHPRYSSPAVWTQFVMYD